MRRLNLYLVLGLAILIAIQYSLAYAQKPYLKLDVDEGNVGSLLTIEGLNFTPKANVTISWLLHNNSKIILRETKTDEEGNFTSIVKVPKDVGGRHLIIAEDEAGISANITFVLKPKLERLVDPAEPDVSLRAVEKGMLLRVIGSGGINGTIIAFDNIPVTSISNVKQDGSFYYDFIAIGKAGERVISLYNYTGEIIDYLIYNLKGMTEEDVAEALIYVGEVSAAARDGVDDLYSKVSRLSIDLNENIGIIRRDMLEIESKIAKNLSAIRLDVKNDLNELERSVKDSISFLAGRISRLESRLTKNMSKGVGEVKNTVNTLKNEIPKIIEKITQYNVEQSSKIEDLRKGIDGLNESVIETRSNLNSAVSEVKNTLSKKVDDVGKDVKTSTKELSSKIAQRIVQLQNLVIFAIIVSLVIIAMQIVPFIKKGKA